MKFDIYFIHFLLIASKIDLYDSEWLSVKLCKETCFLTSISLFIDNLFYLYLLGSIQNLFIILLKAFIYEMFNYFIIYILSNFKTFFTGVLKETVALIKAGASVRETCIHADKRIEEETGKAFKKDKQLQKGKKNYIYICTYL